MNQRRRTHDIWNTSRLDIADEMPIRFRNRKGFLAQAFWTVLPEIACALPESSIRCLRVNRFGNGDQPHFIRFPTTCDCLVSYKFVYRGKTCNGHVRHLHYHFPKGNGRFSSARSAFNDLRTSRPCFLQAAARFRISADASGTQGCNPRQRSGHRPSKHIGRQSTSDTAEQRP